MTDDRGGFDAALADALRAVLEQIARDYPAGGVVAVAVVVDSSLDTVGAAINTREHLEQCMAADPRWAGTYRFWPGEYAEELFADEAFESAQRQLTDLKRASAGDFAAWKAATLERILDAVERVSREAAAGPLGGLLWQLVVTDDEITARQVEWVRRLNDDATAAEFARFAELA